MSEFITVRLGDTHLPIVDVTNPAFAISPSEDELAAMKTQYVIESAQSQDVSPELRAALGRSRLGRGLMSARGTFLTGLNTYLLKLGADNLPADFDPIDKRIAASFPSITARLRLQDMARLISEGLTDRLATDRERPLHFINIAGGPAADSWNTLICLQRCRFGARSSRDLGERAGCRRPGSGIRRPGVRGAAGWGAATSRAPYPFSSRAVQLGRVRRVAANSQIGRCRTIVVRGVFRRRTLRVRIGRRDRSEPHDTP